MASQLEHMSFATFLGYHGTTVSDPLLYRYAELYDSFTQFRYSIPQASIDKAFIKWMQQTATLPTATYLNEPPVYPPQNLTHIEPIVVSTTPTSTTTVIESSNNQAINSLISEYLDDDIHNQLTTFGSLDQHTEPPPPPVNPPDSPTLSLSSLSTISPSPPELQSLPILPPLPSPTPSYIATMAQPLIPKKDMAIMKEEHDTNQKNKRKRVANITPQQQQKPKKRKSGRPSIAETLTRIANNEQTENDQISSQDLILRALDGSEKKKKTILTCSTKSIELYYLKQYAYYDFVGELRKNALDTIREQKKILEKLLHIEKLITQGIEPVQM